MLALVAIGSYLAAQIAKLSALDAAVQQTMPVAELSRPYYQKFFRHPGGVGELCWG